MNIEFLDKVIWRQIIRNMGHMLLSNLFTAMWHIIQSQI